MLKILSLLAVLLFATPAIAFDMSKEPISKNVISLVSDCKQGSASQAIMSHKENGDSVWTLKPDKVSLMEKGVNANLATHNKPPVKIDGAALVVMKADNNQFMVYQFHEGCVISAVLAPADMFIGAFLKMGINAEDWE